ncbi:MAG TPA: flagellar motor protein MotB [Verrucomicrobiae bacterium]|nr:flagellar motor protein MotB [Verrucomicrobiae bacterium]
MKHIPILVAGVAGLLALAGTGCRNTGSPYQPGPVAGQAVGGAAGVVAGNAVGFGKGVVGGTAAGYSAVMDPSYHMVRYWRTEVTSDGRTIQVPYDILVDQYGRPVKMPAPTRNPKPPPSYLPPVSTNAPAN